MSKTAEYSMFEEVTLDRTSLNVILGYGTGDTFNALIHLQKYPPKVPYTLIIKSPQKNLVEFMLRLFSRSPEKVVAIKYWKHDFSVRLAAHFPGIPFARGFEANSNRHGFLDLWQNPFNYQRVAPLHDADIRRIVEVFSSGEPPLTIPPRSAVLFVSAGANFSGFIPKWSRIGRVLKGLGIPEVYVNRSGVPEYGSEDIEGLTPLDLNHSELIRLLYSPSDIRIVAVRSGVLDILRFSRKKALVLYQPNPSGIFETCRFGLLKHNLDLIETICMPGADEYQDGVIEYYLKSFLSLDV
jgi:hypothetical protein